MVRKSGFSPSIFHSIQYIQHPLLITEEKRILRCWCHLAVVHCCRRKPC